MENKYWLSDTDFTYIYSKVPRFNIDLVIYNDTKIVVVKRSIEPYLGFWHLPGGTVYKGETIEEASVRIAKSETGLDVQLVKFLDCLEFLNEKRNSSNMHTISLVVEVIATGGVLKCDKNAESIQFLGKDTIPLVAEHLTFLKKQKILEN